MSIPDLEAAVATLSRDEFIAFQGWFEEYAADEWDRRIEEDIKAGRLDHLVAEADREFEAGRGTPIRDTSRWPRFGFTTGDCRQK